MRLSTIVVLASSVCLVGRAEGQTTTTTPQTWPATFGGAQVRGVPARDGGLELVAQVFGGWDDNVLADQAGGGPRLASLDAGFTAGIQAGLLFSRPGLLYERPTARGDFRTWVNTTVRHYPSLDNLTGTSVRFGLETSAPVSRRLTFTFSPQVDYSPRYSMQLVSAPLQDDPLAAAASIDGGATPGNLTEFSAVQNNILRYGATVGASIVTGTHSTLELDYGYRKRQDEFRANEMQYQTAGIRFDRQLGRNASLELGYSYQVGEPSVGPKTEAHTLDVGLDYQKALTRTRTTFLRFSTGSMIAQSPGGQRIQAVGSATLEHHLGRTWTTIAQYRRQLRYVDDFDRPIFADMVAGGVNGLLTRRTEFAARTRFVRGAVGVTPRSPRFTSYEVATRVRRALKRTLAAYGEYIFYHYEFEEGAVRPVGLPQRFSRNGVRFGLSLWLPLTD